MILKQKWIDSLLSKTPSFITNNKEAALTELLNPLGNYNVKLEELNLQAYSNIDVNILEVFYEILKLEAGVFKSNEERLDFLNSYLKYIAWKGTKTGVKILAKEMFNIDVDVIENTHVHDMFYLSTDKKMSQYLTSLIDREHAYVVNFNCSKESLRTEKMELYRKIIRRDTPLGQTAFFKFISKEAV